MDYLLLWAVKRGMKLGTRRCGLLLGSLFGAAYGLGTMLWPIPVSWLQAVFTWLGASGCMVCLAFRIRSVREGIRAVAVLYGAATAAAGVMELLPWFVPGWAGVSFWLYGLSCLCCVGFPAVFWRFFLRQRERAGHLYRVELTYRGKTETFTGFLDTGNRLTEPVTGSPVCLISAKSGASLFEKLDQVCYIPFRSVGKESGVIPAVRAERMRVWKMEASAKPSAAEPAAVEPAAADLAAAESAAESSGWVIDRPYIAFSKEALSSDDSYQILLHENLFC